MTLKRKILVDREVFDVCSRWISDYGLQPIACHLGRRFRTGDQIVPEAHLDETIAVVVDARTRISELSTIVQLLQNDASSFPVFAFVGASCSATESSCAVAGCIAITIGDFESGRIVRLLDKHSHTAWDSALICTSEDAGDIESAYSLQENQTALLASLHRLAFEMMNRVELSALLQSVADNTGQLTGADYAYLALVHESGEFMETIAVNGEKHNLKSVKHRPGFGIAGQAWLRAETICVADYQSYPHRIADLATGRQACSVPLKINSEVIGVIGVLYESDHYDIYRQKIVLETFAPLASVAIDNARSNESIRNQLIGTEAIGEINREIYSSASFDRIVDKICVTLINNFNVKKTHLYKLNCSQLLSPVVAWENVDGSVVPSTQAAGATVEKSIARWCIDNQKTGFVKRTGKDKRESEEVHRIRAKWSLGSTICVPLMHEGKSWGVLFAHRSADSPDFTDGEVKLFELMGSQLSVALLRRELMLKVEHQAYHDNLTGLANRIRFESLVSQCIETAAHSADIYAVMYIDLDGFKLINDNFGHHRGDKLLKAVTARISAQVTNEDQMARMGGDEFAVVLKRSSRDQIEQAAQRINACLLISIEIDGLRAKVSASIGIVVFPEDGATVDEILKNADFAMYHAKNAGKSTYSMFDQSYRSEYEKRVQREADLRHAITAEQFELYYQPKVNCVNGEVDGVEALIRWNHPEFGFVPPSEFIPIAERTGLIETIGGWVLRTACRHCAELNDHGYEVSVAINISPQQLLADNFVQQVLQAIRDNNARESMVELEVTESVLLTDIDGTVEKLTTLQKHGIRISIDDFGTGYSALHYLEKLPLDVIKIDKSFIDNLCNGGKGARLVEIILLMASALELSTVAEGVESQEQVSKLREMGCDAIQGCFYSRPVPFDELTGVITNTDWQSYGKAA